MFTQEGTSNSSYDEDEIIIEEQTLKEDYED
jgi:hypothetical protein